MKKINSKRNRSKDNPYILNYDDERNTYVVEFKDNFMNTQFVDVSEEVYKASKYMDRHFQTLKEKDIRNHLFSYNALDTDEMLGVEMIPDQSSPSLEDQVVADVMAAKLRRCIELLPDEDKKIIQDIYYEGKSEKEVGKQIGISQKAVSKRLHRTLQKLQKLINR